MSDPFNRMAPGLVLPAALMGLIIEASVMMAQQAHKAYSIHRPSPRRGGTLRPGKQTPLWNELRRQLRPHLTRYGEQANLARLLGLPRQRVNDFLTGGGQMPDAERTLQLLAWLLATSQNRRPS